ncbi:MAG TPA: MarR family transcriptional regulator [Ktedonobacteraceae bacterium]|jgi:DNA-binding MarR family transcriptional regulator|nr:MarR family transcriptional regulator [Ktedonobacteraceae bacterium]
MATDRLVEDLLTLWRLLRVSTHPVRRGEITPEQYWLLKLLNKRGELSIGELAEALGLTGSSVTTACKRLERAGMVHRARQIDGQDERIVLVTLTTQGREQLEAWQQARRDAVTEILTPLAPSEQDELQRLLERILENFPQ